MSRVPFVCAALAAAVLFHAPAVAQEINPLVREQIVIQRDGANSGGRAESRNQQVRVQSSVNMFMPAPTGDGDAAEQWRDRARKMVYQMAARECGMLEEVLAKTCRLEAINVSLQRQPGMGVGDGYMVGGNFTMMVTLK
jgi:hypothetical protein